MYMFCVLCLCFVILCFLVANVSIRIDNLDQTRVFRNGYLPARALTLIATKDIEKGDELLRNYDYEDLDNNKEKEKEKKTEKQEKKGTNIKSKKNKKTGKTISTVSAKSGSTIYSMINPLAIPHGLLQACAYVTWQFCFFTHSVRVTTVCCLNPVIHRRLMCDSIMVNMFSIQLNC